MNKEDQLEIEKMVNSAFARVIEQARKLHEEDMKVFSERWRWDSWESFKVRRRHELKD